MIRLIVDFEEFKGKVDDGWSLVDRLEKNGEQAAADVLHDFVEDLDSFLEFAFQRHYAMSARDYGKWEDIALYATMGVPSFKSHRFPQSAKPQTTGAR